MGGISCISEITTNIPNISKLFTIHRNASRKLTRFFTFRSEFTLHFSTRAFVMCFLLIWDGLFRPKAFSDLLGKLLVVSILRGTIDFRWCFYIGKNCTSGIPRRRTEKTPLHMVWKMFQIIKYLREFWESVEKFVRLINNFYVWEHSYITTYNEELVFQVYVL